MKRFAALLIVALVLSLSFAPSASTSAQNNCVITAYVGWTGPHRVVKVPSGEPITDAVNATMGSTIALPIKVAYSGPANWQLFIGGSWQTVSNPAFNVNCTGNNSEIGAECSKVGIDVTLQAPGPYTLKVFKNGQLFSQVSISVSSGTITHQELITTPIDPADQYTYEVRCSNSGNCGGSNGIPNNALVSQGALARKCDSPCGPSLAGKPLGLMTASVPFHWAPQAGAASTFIAEAGKTFKVLGTSGDFTQVVLACKAYWVPSSAIQIIGN